MTSLLFILLLSAHLICMNVGSAGPLICMGLDAVSTRKGVAGSRAGSWLAWKSVQLACLGAVFGLLMGWLRWDPEYAIVLQRFASRIRWGIAEFVFSVVLLAVYAAWLTARPRVGLAGFCGRTLLALLAATNLLYHFPPLFTLIANGVAGRDQPAIVDSPAFRKLIASSEVMSLTAHFALASVAIAGVMLLVFGWRQPDINQEDSRNVVWVTHCINCDFSTDPGRILGCCCLSHRMLNGSYSEVTPSSRCSLWHRWSPSSRCSITWPPFPLEILRGRRFGALSSPYCL